MCTLGQVDAILGVSWEDFVATWVSPGAILGNVGAILGLSWEDFGATWVNRGVILCHVDPSWGYLEEVWGCFGPPWAS